MKMPREVSSSLLPAMSPLNQRVIAQHRIRVREAGAYVLAFTLAVVIVGGFLRWHVANLYEQEMANWRARQASDAGDRAQRISDWLAERQADAQLFAIYPSVRNALRAHSDAGHLPGRPSGSQRELTASLDEIEWVCPYARVYVLDCDGHVMARSSRSVPLSPLLTEICRKVPETGASRIDLVGKTAEETLISFSVAVVPEPGTLGAGQAPGRPLGVVLVVLDAAHTLFPLVAREPVPTQTGETILVRREGNDMVYFSPLRRIPISSPDLRFPLSGAPAPAHLALQGRKTLVLYNDYRGVPVLAATQYIPLAGWGLVRKIDLAETLRNYHRMAMAEGLAGCLLITILAGFLMFHRRVVLTRVLEQAGEVRAHLAAIVESSEDAIIGKRLDGTIASWNRGAEQLYGYRSKEVMGRSIALLVPADLTDELPAILEKIKRGELVEHYETERVRKDGTRVPVSLTVSPLKDAAGAVVGASSIARDITARKHTEEALRDSEIQFRRLFEAAKDGILILDADTGEIKDVNPFLSDLLDFPRADLLGKKLWEIGPLQDALLSKTSFEDLQSNGYVRYEHLPLETRNGKRVEVEFVSNVYSVGQLRVIQCNIRDITERKRAELRLRQSEEKYRTLFNSVDDGFCIIEVLFDENNKPVDYRFLEINPSFEKQTGIQNAQGKRMREIAPQHEECWFEIYGKIALTGESVRFQNQAAQLQRWYDVYALRVGEPQGKTVAVVFHDVTWHKRAEEEIQRVNQQLEQRVAERTAELEAANKELEAFTYSVSHDLRAPLRHVDGFSKLLVEEHGAELSPDAREYIATIRDSVLLMGMLIDDLLNLARLGRKQLNMQVTGLNSLAEEVMADLKRANPDHLIEWKVETLPFVECDPGLMKQVFANLLSNAVKFTRPRKPTVIEVGVTSHNGARAVFVRDNGVGFSMKYANKLFGVFQRLHRAEDFEGTGVGLATVQRIIHKHGGRVWAEAELDKGATFYFTLGSLDGPATENEGSGAVGGSGGLWPPVFRINKFGGQRPPLQNQIDPLAEIGTESGGNP
jgi:PAS domain S-box-containing protein